MQSLVSAPKCLVRLGTVETGTMWKIRKAVYWLKESPRLWQEERDKVRSKLTWYSPHWKSQMHRRQSRMHPSMWLMMKEPKPKYQQ
eukprot:12893222-Prorocentrum_lima.AAC.1